MNLWDVLLLAAWLGGWLGGIAAYVASEFVLRRRTEARTQCEYCRYDLSGLARACNCPECGMYHDPTPRIARTTTMQRVVAPAKCALPFGLLLAIAAHTGFGLSFGHTGGLQEFVRTASSTLAAYILISLAALAIGRFYSNSVVAILALSAALSGAIAHTLLLLDAFYWAPSSSTQVIVHGAAVFVFPAGGYGMLIAACVLSRRRG